MKNFPFLLFIMLFCFTTFGCQTESVETEEEDVVDVCISSMYETALKISQIDDPEEILQTRAGSVDENIQILIDDFIGDTELCLSTIGFSGEELQNLRTEFGDVVFTFVGVYILNEELQSNQTRAWQDDAVDCLKEAVGLDILAAFYDGAAEMSWKQLFQKKMIKQALKTSAKYLGTVASGALILGEWSWCMFR